MGNSPVRPYRTILNDSGSGGYVNRLLIATPVTGVVRIEWVQARYGQIIPTNWSFVQLLEYLDSYYPLRYQVADAQNLCVQQCIEGDFEWMLFIEHDTVLPPDAFIRFNQYMQAEDTPIVSGLYFTRSEPSEPILYRGRGVGPYLDWKFGEKVWVDGVPTGCLLIHSAILKKMWEESEEYVMRGGQKARRVFNTPRDLWFDPETVSFNMTQGTSDLDWCTRIMKGNYFEKAGWTAYKEKEFPFLVDTNIFCRHININGEQFPKGN